MVTLLFGAGHYALVMKRYLQEQGIEISGVLVSKKEMDYLEELSIYTPQEICYPKEKCEVVFGLSSRYHKEVEESLQRNGFRHFIFYSDEKLQSIYERYNSVDDRIIKKYHHFFPQKKSMPDSLDNILVIRLDGIGDAVLTTPFLRELRRNLPSSKITLLVSNTVYNLFEICPYVDNVVSVDWYREIMNAPILESKFKNAQRFMLETFQGEKFDVVILPRYDVDSYGASFLSLFSGAPYRLAYSEKTTREKAKANKNYDVFFSHVFSGCGVCHEVKRNLQILEKLGMDIKDDRLELWHDDRDMKQMMNVLETKGQQLFYGKKIIVIGLASSEKFRRWKVDNYILVIKRLLKLEGENLRFVLIGGKMEDDLGIKIINSISIKNVVDLTNRLSLREVYCLLKKGALYIGHDTGVMHIACAARIPVVEISPFPIDAIQNHANSPARFGPWRTECAILQPRYGIFDSKGWHNERGTYSINDIPPESVIKTVCGIIKNSS